MLYRLNIYICLLFELKIIKKEIVIIFIIFLLNMKLGYIINCSISMWFCEHDFFAFFYFSNTQISFEIPLKLAVHIYQFPCQHRFFSSKYLIFYQNSYKLFSISVIKRSSIQTEGNFYIHMCVCVCDSVY